MKNKEYKMSIFLTKELQKSHIAINFLKEKNNYRYNEFIKSNVHTISPYPLAIDLINHFKVDDELIKIFMSKYGYNMSFLKPNFSPFYRALEKSIDTILNKKAIN